MSRSALTAFRTQRQFLALAEELARPAGLTATRWQVLVATRESPLTVSDVARAMGITRQSVQRTADILAADGLIAYRDNPAHVRAKIVAPTDAGIAAVGRINPQHSAAADALAERLGEKRWQAALEALEALSAALTAL
ncbi:MarR family winged helix-turn-helix transcriptional regulator [Gordonia sp. NPDC003950]